MLIFRVADLAERAKTETKNQKQQAGWPTSVSPPASRQKFYSHDSMRSTPRLRVIHQQLNGVLSKSSVSCMYTYYVVE